ncbi:MAG: hypothetical protein JXR37_26840 [Kiritimatiellae bacterium]|nr:hypothetical protein [Kiritimatiellia bacterium]
MRKDTCVGMWAAAAVGVAVVLGLIDWVSGHEFNFFVFYFLPVAVAAWFCGPVGAVALALVCAMVWFGADHLSQHAYASVTHAVWNTMIRLISFLAIGWSVAKLKQMLDRERQTANALRRSLSEIKVLETFLPICAQCKKIRNQEGVWQHLEVYIGEHSNTQFSHGYCPECAKKAIEEAGLLETRLGRHKAG